MVGQVVGQLGHVGQSGGDVVEQTWHGSGVGHSVTVGQVGCVGHTGHSVVTGGAAVVGQSHVSGVVHWESVVVTVGGAAVEVVGCTKSSQNAAGTSTTECIALGILNSPRLTHSSFSAMYCMTLLAGQSPVKSHTGWPKIVGLPRKLQMPALSRSLHGCNGGGCRLSHSLVFRLNQKPSLTTIPVTAPSLAKAHLPGDKSCVGTDPNTVTSSLSPGLIFNT